MGISLFGGVESGSEPMLEEGRFLAGKEGGDNSVMAVSWIWSGGGLSTAGVVCRIKVSYGGGEA